MLRPGMPAAEALIGQVLTPVGAKPLILRMSMMLPTPDLRL